MILNEISELLKAGFTKEEILKLAEADAVPRTPPKAPETEPTTQPKPEPKPKPETEPKPEPESVNQTEAQLKALTASVDGLMKAIQAANLKNSSGNSEDTSVEHLANIIINGKDEI